MYKIKEEAFSIATEDIRGAFEIMLQISSHSLESFCKYMEIPLLKEEDEPPKWAINYLKDYINANYLHLGYIMKDSGVSGLMGAYNKLEDQVAELTIENSSSLNQPIVINKTIIAKDGPINTSFIVHSETILKEFIRTLDI